MIDGRMMLSSDLEEFLHTNDNSSGPYTFVYELAEYYSPSIDRNRLILIAAYCSLFVLGLAGNIWVTFVVGRVFCQTRTEAPKSVQLFILSLCLCELTMLTFLIFLICDLIYGRWILHSRFLCRLYLSSEGFNKFCSPFLLASLSGFCYARLRGTPGSAHSTASTRKAAYLVSACFLFSLLLMTPIYEYGDLYYLIEFNDTHVLNVVTKCAFHPPEKIMIAFTAYGFVAGYAVPAALFTFFYAAALSSARKQRKRSSCYQNSPGNGKSDQQNNQNNQNTNSDQLQRCGSRSTPGSSPAANQQQNGDPLVGSGSPYLRRVRTTTFGLIFVYLFCWTPWWIMSLYHVSTPHDLHGFESQGAVVFSYFVHMLPYINCAVYPLVYTLLNSHLKKDYKRATAARKRRRLAVRKPRTRLPPVFGMIRHKYSSQSIMTAATATTTARSSVDVNRSSFDNQATISKNGLDEQGSSTNYRKSSSCQLFTPMEDRFQFAKASLRRTLTPGITTV